MKLRIVCISDTHMRHRSVRIPEGDVLVHAGDITRRGDLADLVSFNAFLGELPHPVKIVIAGNHDFCLERQPLESEAVLTNAIYLRDRAVVAAGLTIYGSPWQPRFFDWAFNLDRGRALQEKWDLIPEGLDVLVTHGPPSDFGDRVGTGERVGCADLLAAVRRLRPRLHVFGHIHEDAGVWRDGPTTFVNASTCDLAYRATQPPIVQELEL